MLGERKLAVPAEGLQVRNPETDRPLPPEGEVVTVTVFWARRARDRDVVLRPLQPIDDAVTATPVALEPESTDEAPKRGRRNDR